MQRPDSITNIGQQPVLLFQDARNPGLKTVDGCVRKRNDQNLLIHANPLISHQTGCQVGQGERLPTARNRGNTHLSLIIFEDKPGLLWPESRFRSHHSTLSGSA
jgi:hypothetical protein